MASKGSVARTGIFYKYRPGRLSGRNNGRRAGHMRQEAIPTLGHERLRRHLLDGRRRLDPHRPQSVHLYRYNIQVRQEAATIVRAIAGQRAIAGGRIHSELARITPAVRNPHNWPTAPHRIAPLDTALGGTLPPRIAPPLAT
ncbi:hypothetical protein VTG60DRAFT_3687 [Thermothelomyces hinnuleus]